ncbi:uncharacterized protein FPRO_05676 [Fusarium proliferatum ET1]|uniref:DUF676 domain-containing protein n=1 Tax=Fusarium proliferatum (strain ET1) TaxID=1227346 RepID=A0A1L7VFU9_FUSPR|nr:uncharacterized protein FPRO_05676 [Fusarium proliferatum ET1]CZR39132.1 uncharacterized protein FPRO_05676 [Fusarium proliferatum ET1]
MAENPTGLLQVAGPEDAVVDIVFVHGVTGGRESDWTSKNNTFWLETFLPQSIPNARILTWGYSKRYLSDEGWNTAVLDHTIEMCNGLIETRTHTPYRPIIFVGHNIGALMCANFQLVGGHYQRIFGSIADCVRGIIFLGTPCTAFTEKEARAWQRRLLSLSIELFHDYPSNDFYFPSKFILDGFWGLRQRINTFSFYEEDGIASLGKVTTKDMATPPDKSFEPLSIPGNHITMCQFDSSDEPGYIMIKWLLQKWIRELPKPTSGGPADPTEPSLLTKVPALDTPAELHILHELLGLSTKEDIPISEDDIDIFEDAIKTFEDNISISEDDISTSEGPKGRLNPLLSPEAIRWLVSKDLLSSIQQGRLTISTAPLLESFKISTTDSSSTEGSWSLSEDDKPFLRSVDIPIRLYSLETYEFLGYECKVAENLWDVFNSSLNPSFSLLEVSKAYLEDNPESHANFEYDCNNFMAKIGICDSLRNSVLDWHFENIRLTRSCEFWLRTSFEVRWQELQALNEDILKVMKRTASTGEKPVEPISSVPSREKPVESIPSVPSRELGTNTKKTQSSEHHDTVHGLVEQHTGKRGDQGPTTSTTSATTATEPKNEEVTLWRGGLKRKYRGRQ